MSSGLLRLYHHLPYPGKVAAAAARGWHLRRWRYGEETEELVAAAEERESWDAGQWRSWQEERLGSLLERAASLVPAYRDDAPPPPRRGGESARDWLARWPVLEKERVRRAPRRFLADDAEPRRLFREATSGTTGSPLALWWPRSTVREWYALWEARARRWYGVDRGDAWGILGGQLVTAAARRRPPFWVWNPALRQLYLSSYHISPATAAAYFDAIERHGVQHLLGYSSALHALAHEGRRLGRRVPLKVVVTNAEPLFAYQRATIGEVFACPVRETYGMAELVAAASECEAGRLHEWPDVGVIEAIGDAAGNRDLVATGLLNPGMPLVRYRVGDQVSPGAPQTAPCPCGRRLPILPAVEGRRDDVLYTRDGRSIGRLDPVFKADLPLREAQIVQETLGRIRVRYVPAEGFAPEHRHEIADRLRDRLGDVEVVCEEVVALPRTASGKLRAVVCQLTPAEREAIGEPAGAGA